MNEKVLLVEDEASIRRFTKIVLKKHGFNVLEADSGEAGLDIVNQESPLVVLLDVMLPGINGFEVCKKIRETNPNIGIIMLTARSQDKDKIEGLNHGADDYLVKPFNPLELSARIQSLLRRMDSKSKSNNLISGPFKIDLDAKLVSKDNLQLNLTPKEFLLLKILIENKNKVLNRSELLDLVWGYNYIGDPKIVDVNVRRLRSKLEKNPSEPDYVETIWGMGYIWKEN
ncbi:response regulator transcription factor [Clostridium grantii]|uniref:Stage 0 sporulation protein A homolog n=1 Tax=Clostridium grantii DSM 8605 TaxID=1121316 RepID=A0A1M5XI89_9CLOT|nr:response regulator transcription factor [Clostridium grantii]SHH99469.1 DNA-binding response regulator, OmpR family, contains REC and winged-helix (wHTH) domain [Clostridium grantii DSM 8605]